MAILGGHAATMLLLLTYLYFSAGNYGEAHNWEKYFENSIVVFKTYRHSSIPAASVSAIFDSVRFMILSFFSISAVMLRSNTVFQ